MNRLTLLCTGSTMLLLILRVHTWCVTKTSVISFQACNDSSTGLLANKRAAQHCVMQIVVGLFVTSNLCNL